MGLPLTLALRYMRSKQRAFVSVGTMFAILGVALGVAALSTVISVTGGFRAEFREKVLGVNAHVLVLKYSSDFREYRKVMDKVKDIPGVTGVAPFVINPMMLTHGTRTATGVLLKGVDPGRVNSVLDLPRHIKHGSMSGLRLPEAKPPERRRRSGSDDFEPLPPPAGSGAAAPTSSAQLPRGFLADLEDYMAKEASEPDAKTRASAFDASGADRPGEVAEETEPEPGAPVGDVEPEGGFTSKLPEDDILPEQYDPDPCKDPQQVQKLPGIVIGATLQKNLDAKLGDCIQVTSPTIGFSYSRGAMHAPVAKQFRVVAVFDAGFDPFTTPATASRAWK
jgi:lipoprotein-releasing system permease protein